MLWDGPMSGSEGSGDHILVGSHIAHLREKYVRCGKPNCTKCPHGPYVYLSYRAGSTVKTQYVGKSQNTSKRQPEIGREKG